MQSDMEPLTFDLIVSMATPREAAWVKGFDSLSSLNPSTTSHPLPYHPVTIEGKNVALVITGAGPINVALALGSLLTRIRSELLFVVGVGGAYPCSGLKTGDLAVASLEIDVDTGVEPLSPLLPKEPLSIKTKKGAPALYPLSNKYNKKLFNVATTKANTKSGSFITSATVTSSAERAENLLRQHHAIVENMEGAAAAHAADMFGLEMAELRGISNMVGPRDLSNWELDEAIKNAGAVAQAFISSL
jgi:futalosine hydrolase